MLTTSPRLAHGPCSTRRSAGHRPPRHPRKRPCEAPGNRCAQEEGFGKWRLEHLGSRESVLAALKSELVGPDPRGHELDFSRAVKFAAPADSYGPWRQMGSGEEVLQDGMPTQRYGVGVLYAANEKPPVETEPLETPPAPGDGEESGPDLLRGEARRHIESQLEQVAAAAAAGSGQEPADDFDIAGANDYRPTTMAVSFLADVRAKPTVVIEAHGGRYTPHEVLVGDRSRRWWLRSAVTLQAEFSSAAIAVKRAQAIPASKSGSP